MNNTIYVIIIFYLIVSIISFILFAVDKRKAIKSVWRIPEKTLILSSFLGGALGGLIAMRVFRHKIRKPKFFILVPLFLILQILVLAGVIYHEIQIPFI